MTPEKGRRQEWELHTVLRCGSYVRAQVAMILGAESDATLTKEPRLSTREAARRADCRPESAQDAIAALRDLGAVVVVGVDGRKVATFRLVPAWWEHDRSGGPDQSRATTDPVDRISPEASTDPVDRIDPVDFSDRSGGPDQSDLATDPVSRFDRSGQPSRDLIFGSESSNQNPPFSRIDLTINPPGAHGVAQASESISSTGTESRDESETAEVGAPVRVVASQSSSRPVPVAQSAVVDAPSQASRPTAAEIAFGAELIRSTWTRPADRDLSLDEERAVSALHKAIGDRDIERAELAWGRVEIARLGAHVATMPIREVMMARTNVAAALNGKLPPPPMTDEERRERMARLLAATAEKRGDAAPAPPPTPAELPPESRRRIAEVMGTRAPLSGAALDAHNAAVRARAVASYGEEAVAEIERRHATIRARATAELAERRGSTRTRVTS